MRSSRLSGFAAEAPAAPTPDALASGRRSNLPAAEVTRTPADAFTESLQLSSCACRAKRRRNRPCANKY